MNTDKNTTQLHKIHSQNFIVKNRKVSWQALYQNGELCIGENTVKQFLMEKDAEIEKLENGYNYYRSVNKDKVGMIVSMAKTILARSTEIEALEKKNAELQLQLDELRNKDVPVC